MRHCVTFMGLMLMLLPSVLWAQVSKSARSNRYSVPNMSKIKARIACPIFDRSEYPYNSIGIKMGDPFAITYKYFANKRWAFAADAGKSASGLYNRYYRGLFGNYLPDTASSNTTLSYLSHKAKIDWYGEVKALYQWKADKISKGLQLYTGVGFQCKQARIVYNYAYQTDLPSMSSKIGEFSEKRFTYGAVGILGFEYSYFSLPVSAFIELEWYTDLHLDPSYHRLQGGVGLRYVF